jgi:hypothetical protein
MERRETVSVKSGKEYNHLFPRAMLTSITKKKGATVADTIKFIPQVVNDTLFHTEKIAKILKRPTVYETCEAIWHFVYDHIAYKKDAEGKEQIRSPARAWHDRGNIKGVDCDCYTVFISSILTNLKIRHALRIAKYKEDYFQHIYPVVALKDGDYITIDCVVRDFDYEEPYTEKKDTKMDLEYLNGVNDSAVSRNTDAAEFSGINDDREAMASLGSLFKGKFMDKVKGVIHKINVYNPGTVPIRMGILASMKLNVFHVAQNLKWAYITDENAKKQGVDIGKLANLRKIKDKLENIFFHLGGKPENFKKAILEGRGNRHHEVSGLGYTPEAMEGMDENTPLSGLLGDIYHDEMSDMKGLGELGEPVTAATIAAASGILGTIAALIKKIGSIFPKKAAPAEGEAAAETTKEETPDISIVPSGGKTKNHVKSSGAGESGGSESAGESTAIVKSGEQTPDEAGAEAGANNKMALMKSADPTGTGTGADGKPLTFWAKNKKWLKPVAIGVGGLGIIYVGYRIMSHKKPEKPPSSPALTGVPKSKKKKKKGGGNVKSKKKKKAVPLM